MNSKVVTEIFSRVKVYFVNAFAIIRNKKLINHRIRLLIAL